MAEPYRRKDSCFYWIGYTDPETKKRRAVSTGKKTLNDARIVARRVLADMDRLRDLGRRKTTLEAALLRYTARAKARKMAGADDVEHHAKRLLGRVEGKWGFRPEMPLETLSGGDLDTLRTHRIAEGFAPNTINHELWVLSSAWRMARDTKYDVAEGLRFRRAKVVPKTRWFTPEEYEAVRKELDPDTPIPGRAGSRFVPGKETPIYQQRQDAHDLFVMMCLTGGRWGEVSTVTFRMLDQTVASLFGWKTGRERAVPLAGMLAEIIERRRAAAPRSQVHVFPGGRGRKTRQGPCRAISRAIDRAGCNPPHMVRTHGRATIHSCRHTFASWLLQGGASLADVQALLGHQSIEMTMRYAHIDGRRTVARATAILDAMGFGSASEPQPAQEATAVPVPANGLAAGVPQAAND